MQNNSENPFAGKLSPEILANREFKSSLFTFIFTKDKKNALSLYNAVKGTNYTNTEDLKFEILDGALFIGMRNDVSFLFAKSLSLYEHQSTHNPNMPLRGFLYFAELYKRLIDKNWLYRSTLLKIPTPQYIVFYNGQEKRTQPDITLLRLSDAFDTEEKPEGFEWTATILNINNGHNKELMKSCKLLSDYAVFVDLVRKYNCELSLENAILKAIDECIKRKVLLDIMQKYRWEVAYMSWTEFDADGIKKVLQEEIDELKEHHSMEIADKDAQIADKDAQIADKDAQIADKNAQIADKDAQIANKIALLADKDAEIADKNGLIATKEAQLVNKDIEIAARDAEITRLYKLLSEV